MNLSRARATDDSSTAELIVRRMAPGDWIKVAILLGGFAAAVLTLRVQNEERWTNQQTRDTSQDKKLEELKADMANRLNRIEDKQDRMLEALGGKAR